MKAVVRALVRWSWLLALCAVVGWFGGKELAVLNPPTYQATAYVQLNAQSRTSGIVQPVAAYATMVTSDAILGQVLKKYPTVSRQSLGTKQLVVTIDNPSQTISIQVTLPAPKMAAGLANDLAQQLVSQQNAYIKSQYNMQLQILKNQYNQYHDAIEKLNQQMLATPATDTTAIQQLQSQVAQQTNLEAANITATQTLTTQQALYSDPLTVTQAATVPPKPSSLLGQIPFAPLTFVIVLALGVVAIFLIEGNAGRIDKVYPLQQKVSLPILGSLSWVSPGPQTIPLRAICESKLPYAEQCRVMMADVLFRAEEAKARVLAITGTRVRAGSSSIAAELAALLAQSKRRVLLIDANLYGPSLHERLELPNEAGLARMLEEARNIKIGVTPGGGPSSVEVIGGSLPVDSFIMPTAQQNLYLLPAGHPHLNPSSLLSMPEMGQFLRWAMRSVDYIVLDCPSILHADAHMLGGLSDQTYLVVDATKDRMKQVVSTKEELMNTGVKLSGLIVNKLGRWI